MKDAKEIKFVVQGRCESVRHDLMDLSHQIHAHPEVGFEEYRASEWLVQALSKNGLDVEKGICGLPTAFLAKAGRGSLHVAICAEYDCLPGIGHACGHNLIAAMAVGAGISLAAVAEQLGLTVSVIGTPAEEVGNGSGKMLLLEGGAFTDVHAALMVHPAPFDAVFPRIIAASMFEVHYTGKAAHASAFPELGINAADALTVAQTAIGLLRQHLPATARVHGIVTQGGEAPNIVPAQTRAKYMVREQTLSRLEEFRPRIYHCFEAGALATGASLEIIGGEKPYAEMHHDVEIAALYKTNAEALGRSFPDIQVQLDRAAGSTDMGNVSLQLPAIHPFIGVDSLPAVNHQPEFAAHCITEAADKAVYDGALAMAWTAVDMATDEKIRDRLVKRRE